MKFYECEESANLCTVKPLLCFIKQKEPTTNLSLFQNGHLVPARDKEKDSEYSEQENLKVK